MRLRRGSSRRSPDPLVGWGGDTLPRPHPTRRLRRLDPRGPPALGSVPRTIIPSYATEIGLHLLIQHIEINLTVSVRGNRAVRGSDC